MSEFIIPHHHKVTASDRSQRMGHRSKLLWFTGLSGSGKSTLASELEVNLFNEGVSTYILDGDNVRSGLNQDLSFDEVGRKENIRRIAEVSRLFLDAGIVTLTAFISPYKEDRQSARSLVGDENFVEIYVKCSLEVCEKRDVKGLYKKARAGLIPNFTGIDLPFEEPTSPDLVVDTETKDLASCVSDLTTFIYPLIRK